MVVYTSDNGFFLGEHGLFDKRLMYEPSIRVPFLVRFPARAKAGAVDRTHMVLNVDLAPTLLELAAVPVPAGLHGRSLVPLLEGRDAPWRDAFLYEYYEYPAEHCVRKNRGVRTRRRSSSTSRSSRRSGSCTTSPPIPTRPSTSPRGATSSRGCGS